MSREEIQNLLGGYATGTLTPEEQRVLFAAALEDQELFDAMANEEALRDLLSDPAARAHLLAAMDEAPLPWYRRWSFPGIRSLSIAALAAALIAVTGVTLWQNWQPAPKPVPTPVRMAKVELPPLPQTQAPPLLPPPPELKPAAPPAMTPLNLPLAEPAPAPPPPPAAQPKMAPAMASLQAPVAQPQAAPAPPQQAQQQAQSNDSALSGRAAFAPSAGNSLLASTVPLHGVVTDAAGTPLPSANVTLKSLATGDVSSTSTDQRGEFNAPAAPGNAYQISASAPGFRTMTVSRVTPAFGEPEPVKLSLDVGTAAETIEVTAAAPMMSRAAGKGGGGGGAMKAKKAQIKAKMAPPELQYQVLRRMPAGDWRDVTASATAPPGAALMLSVTPLADGYLRVVEIAGQTSRTLANPRVHGGIPFQTALPAIDTPGSVRLDLYFSRQPVEAKEPAPTASITLNIR